MENNICLDENQCQPEPNSCPVGESVSGNPPQEKEDPRNTPQTHYFAGGKLPLGIGDRSYWNRIPIWEPLKKLLKNFDNDAEPIEEAPKKSPLDQLLSSLADFFHALPTPKNEEASLLGLLKGWLG